MTVVDTIYDTINDNWGGGGYGGAAPSISSGESQVFKDLTTADAITVIALPHKETAPPVNDKYVDRYYTINVEITSKTTAAQLKLIIDETEYLLRNTAMTGVKLVRIDKDYFRPNQMAKWGCTMRVEVVALMSDGAVTSAAGATASMQALLMYGASNAAWVPCIMEGASANAQYYVTASTIVNLGAVDCYYRFSLPLPTAKGSLKLYISGIRVGIYDADADDYVTQTLIYGDVYNSATTLLNDTTDYTSAQRMENTFAAVDCSVYDHIHATLLTFVTTGTDLDIIFVTMRCYYDT